MERYYPVKDVEGINRQLYARYASIHNPKVTFMGRLGLYAYLDMHQCVSAALKLAQDFIESKAGEWRNVRSVS
jgi:UDP-galactopyranose mutase